MTVRSFEQISTLNPSEGNASQVLGALTEAYFADARPWVIAFSGGKDSTAVLQLVIEMLERLQTPHKPVFVLSSDTRVEAPNIVDYVERVLKAVQEHGANTKLPLHTEMVRPPLEQTFWAKLIGRGYPPPTRWFRWCTSNMKIKPSRAAIDTIVREHGSVVLLLGSRIAESNLRSRGIASREINSRGLNPHHEIPNAFVMTPIVHWSTDDVWQFLFENNPPPWGQPHDELLSLYRQANGGECPVVIDLNTPSCGGSRFGCWTCTVVKLDRSMEGFLQSEENQWMRPLNDFRNWLKEIRESSEFRETRRRNGAIGLGPFTPVARRMILERLLRAEKEFGRHLIRNEEILYIQKEWSREFDFEESALKLARECGRNVRARGEEMDIPEDQMELLAEIAGNNEINEEVLLQLLCLEEDFPDLHAWGVRSNLNRRVSGILVQAANQADLANSG